MPDRAKTLLTVGVHALIVLVIAALAARGFKISDTWAGYAEAALLALGVGAYTAAQHWLAGRAGGSYPAKLARTVAAVMSLGLGALSPDPTPAVPPAPPAAPGPPESVPIQ